MIRRIWKYNRLFMMLFIISLLMTNVVFYYLSSINRQISRINRTIEKSKYGTHVFIAGEWEENLLTELFNMDDLYKLGSLSCVTTTQVENLKNVKIETVIVNNTNDLPMYEEGTGDDEISCYTGDCWNKYTTDGFINVNGKGIKVSGQLMPNAMDFEDERIVVVGSKNTIINFYKKYIDCCVIRYASYDSENSCKVELEQLLKLCDKYSKSGVEKNVMTDSEFGYSNEKYSLNILHAYNTIGMGLMLFCLLNLLYLMYVWIQKYKFEFVIKRVLGYKYHDIIYENIRMCIGFCAIALLFMVAITFAYEVMMGNIEVWLNNIKSGWIFILGSSIGTVFIMNLFSAVLLININPQIVLRNNE